MQSLTVFWRLSTSFDEAYSKKELEENEERIGKVGKGTLYSHTYWQEYFAGKSRLLATENPHNTRIPVCTLGNYRSSICVLVSSDNRRHMLLPQDIFVICMHSETNIYNGAILLEQSKQLLVTGMCGLFHKHGGLQPSLTPVHHLKIYRRVGYCIIYVN